MAMTQQEKYAMHLPYGLKLFSQPQFGEYAIENLTGVELDCIRVEGEVEYPPYETKPYFRPWSQLTQECVQKDYNDGKPFVPVNELKNEFLSSNIEWGNYSEYGWIGFSDKEDVHIPVLFLEEISDECPFLIVKLLLKWHFPVGFEAGEYIEVTNNNNPYK